MKGKLFDKPQGPSQRTWRLSGHTSGDILCEACGTEHSCRTLLEDETFDFSIIMGVQIVDLCCGAYIDKLFKNLGQTFCYEYLLVRFRSNSLEHEESGIRFAISEAIQAWVKAATEAQEEAKKVAAKLPSIL